MPRAVLALDAKLGELSAHVDNVQPSVDAHGQRLAALEDRVRQASKTVEPNRGSSAPVSVRVQPLRPGSD